MVKPHKDLTGQLFGRWLVLEQAEDYIYPASQIHAARWRCQCSCESKTIKDINAANLLNGKSMSCGCLQKELLSSMNSKINKYNLSGEYGVGWTTNSNMEFYFDLKNFDKIKNYCWVSHKHGNAMRLVATDKATGKQVKMHQVLGFANYDHIDHNELNNLESNLRQCTKSQNSQNVSISTKNKSGVIGVWWKPKDDSWGASIQVNNKRYYLGSFKDKNDAIVARLTAEKKYCGEFAPQQYLYDTYNIK
jgi:mRNA-degrading endonuclease HigB of HigAB toxin-antitoxin module